QRAVACGRARFTLQGFRSRTRTLGRRFAVAMPGLGILLRFLPRTGRTCGGEFHSKAARFGKTDGNRLLRRRRAVLSFPYVMHLFANKLSCLGGSRFSLPGVF